VLDLKEAENRHRKWVTIVRGIEKEEDGPMVNGDRFYSQLIDEEMSRIWSEVLKAALVKLDLALDLAINSVDLSSRLLDSRIAILKGEISTKRKILDILA